MYFNADDCIKQKKKMVFKRKHKYINTNVLRTNDDNT